MNPQYVILAYNFESQTFCVAAVTDSKSLAEEVVQGLEPDDKEPQKYGYWIAKCDLSKMVLQEQKAAAVN